MSPGLLERLLRLQRQTRRDVSAANRDVRAELAPRVGFGSYTVRDYFRPAELVWRSPAWLRWGD